MKLGFVVASIVIAVACNAWFVEHAVLDLAHDIRAHFQEIK